VRTAPQKVLGPRVISRHFLSIPTTPTTPQVTRQTHPLRISPPFVRFLYSITQFPMTHTLWPVFCTQIPKEGEEGA